MSTVVLTLVVVGGSIAVAAKLAASGERKPATERARTPPRPPTGTGQAARRAAAAPVGAAAVDQVPARPGVFRRLRAGVTLVAIVAVIGAGIALGLLAGVTVISQAVETAVQ